MTENKIRLFFALLRSAIGSERLGEYEISQCTEEALNDIMTLAERHDLAHLAVLGLNKNGLLFKDYEQSILKAIYRHEIINHEFNNLCEAFEEAQIAFVPLKGSVLRYYYPEPWMRTSCDIDILIHEEDIKKAVELLVKHRGYTSEGQGANDISLFLGNHLHLELHYTLVGEGAVKSSSDILKNVWEYARVKEQKCYWYEMTDDMFYFYHIAHMAKHFENGGCGIRPFIDLLILDNVTDKNLNRRRELLDSGDLSKFEETAKKLTEVWFKNASHTELTKQMEQFILHGGIYGTKDNRITIQQPQKGGHFKYTLSRIFVPYNILKFHYPILQKHCWLTPFFEVYRWIRIIFSKRSKNALSELKYNHSISNDDIHKMKSFLNNIGL